MSKVGNGTIEAGHRPSSRSSSRTTGPVRRTGVTLRRPAGHGLGHLQPVDRPGLLGRRRAAAAVLTCSGITLGRRGDYSVVVRSHGGGGLRRAARTRSRSTRRTRPRREGDNSDRHDRRRLPGRPRPGRDRRREDGQPDDRQGAGRPGRASPSRSPTRRTCRSWSTTSSTACSATSTTRAARRLRRPDHDGPRATGRTLVPPPGHWPGRPDARQRRHRRRPDGGTR